jgi:solute carrier family 13 (sodium-dependent dicarboxylate transporter), member 2/3/5
MSEDSPPGAIPAPAPIEEHHALLEGDYGWRQRGGLVLGLAALLACFFAPPLFGLSSEASRVALLAITMAIFWVTEALPIPATALLPLVMLPALGITTGKTAMKDAAAPYADPIIFLFMGGFMLSLAMERWNLHRRIALAIIAAVGTKPRALLFGFLSAAAFVSLWTSNAATTMMLMPIGLSVYGMIREGQGAARAAAFGSALVLAIAYGANVGGMGSLIGTPPNTILKGYMETTHGIEISFAQWLKMGLPLVLIALPLVHLILTRVSFRVENIEVEGIRERLGAERRGLGRITFPEWTVAAAFLLAVGLWVSREHWKASFPAITDEVIAMVSALILFAVPVDFKKGVFVLDWTCLRKMPWDVLILYGGGLSLAAAIEKTQLAAAMATALGGMAGWPPFLIVTLVCAVMVVATALTSNTATTAAFLPVIGSLAVAVDQPVLLLCIPVTLAASADFALPVGTPPNAIAFGTGLVSLPRMVKAGIWVDLLFVILIPVVMWTIGRWVFGV